MVCHECSHKTTDEKGNPVHYNNTNGLGHGCEASYVDKGEKYECDICYIKGIKCKAEEGYFGGIVVQVLK